MPPNRPNSHWSTGSPSRAWGAGLDVAHVVDETPVITQTANAVGAYAVDPSAILAGLDAQGRAILDAAQQRCREAGVEAAVRLVHDVTVAGIVAAAEQNGDELIVLGTHARSGLPRAFLGSTTEGVLRVAKHPVLAVRSGMPAPPSEGLFRKVLVAVDDSDPADAAVALAARLSQTLRSACVLCSVFDPSDAYDKAGTYGYDPTPLVDELRAHAQLVVDRARARGGFADGTASVAVVEDEPTQGIIAEAARVRADAIVIGSHGRRGLRRLVLGSVAEHVVRGSSVPVVVVRAS